MIFLVLSIISSIDMKLYLVRHAIPRTKNYSNVFPGPGLGKRGKIEAQWIANQFRAVRLDQILASSFPRVVQTIKPLLELKPDLPIRFSQAIWEREPSLESHESLFCRVNDWFTEEIPSIHLNTTAIFSHCGPINMILEILDPLKQKLTYPFVSQHGCYTPCAGIWDLEILNGQLVSGELHTQ